MKHTDEELARMLASKARRPDLPTVKRVIQEEWGSTLSRDIIMHVLGVSRRTAYRLYEPDQPPPHPFQILELHLRLELPQIMNAFYRDMGLPWWTVPRVIWENSVDPEARARIELEGMQSADDQARTVEEVLADNVVTEDEGRLVDRVTEEAHRAIARMGSLAKVER